MKLKEIINLLEAEVPLVWQEGYDNSGLATGDVESDITSALLCVDITLEVMEEAVVLNANLIISHHPLIFTPLKNITDKDGTGRILLMAIRNNIAVYCAHTNLDNTISGVNKKICDKLGLINTRILVPARGQLQKLVTYVPIAHAGEVRAALFSAGAGHIGQYDSCSFNATGKGSFRALEGASPFTGEVGKLHFEDEIRIETVFPAHLQRQIIGALIQAHPYEEVAYDIYGLENSYDRVGAGMIGELKETADEHSFLLRIKDVFKCKMIRHSKLTGKSLKSIAVCGGSGAFLISAAKSAGADFFLTGEIKYHQFFEAQDNIVIADTGHYESEQFTIEIFYDILKKNLPNFAVHFSHIITSPIYYF